MSGRGLESVFGLRLLLKPGVRWTVLALVLGLVMVFRAIQVLIFTGRIQWGYDFSAYWQAGRNLLDGGSIYLAGQLAGPYPPQAQYLYLYPPPLAVAVAPIAAAFDDYRLAQWAWFGLGAVVVAASVWAVAGALGFEARRARLALVGAAFAFPPVVGELIIGNVHALLLGLVSAAWLGLRRGSARGDAAAGLAIGAATVIKVFPGILVVWLVLARRWRAAGWALAATAVISAVSVPFAGLDAWLDYPAVLANLSAPSDTTDALAPTVWLAELVPFALARVIVTGAGLALVAWAALRMPLDAGFGVAVAVSILVAPALYHHYLVLLVLPMLIGLGVGLRAGRAAGGLPWWVLAAFLLMFGGDQSALGNAAWVLNRALPTLGALLVVAGLLRR